MSERDEPKRLIPWDSEDSGLTDADLEDEDDPPSECPAGGEHDVAEIRAATNRGSLQRFCTKCREPM